MIAVKETDHLFTDSPDAGDPDCLCSRCSKRIGEEEVPVRMVVEGRYEYRYHAACLGLQETSV